MIARLACRCDYRGECLVSRGRFIAVRSANRLCAQRAMSRDAVNYPQPDEFLPERFMASEKVIETPSFAFGFGRRVW